MLDQDHPVGGEPGRRAARDEGRRGRADRRAARSVAEDRPGALDSAVLRGAERRMGITGLPVIFDLPQAMAVQRAEEFRQYVHPVLQAYCAKCHNADYDGPFQLVPASNPDSGPATPCGRTWTRPCG